MAAGLAPPVAGQSAVADHAARVGPAGGGITGALRTAALYSSLRRRLNLEPLLMLPMLLILGFVPSLLINVQRPAVEAVLVAIGGS